MRFLSLVLGATLLSSGAFAAGMAPRTCDDEQVILTLTGLFAKERDSATILFANSRLLSEEGAVTTCEADYETTPDGLSGTVRYVIQRFARSADANSFNEVPLEGGVLNFQGEGFAVLADWQNGSDT